MVTAAPPAVLESLRALVERRVDPGARAWLAAAVAAAGDPAARPALLEAFTGAGRRLGREALAPDPAARQALTAAGVTWPVESWGLDDAGRVVLLLAAAIRWPAGAFEALVEEGYRQGDTRERRAVLRGLPLLPAAERFVPLGIEACRTSVQPVFEAIACENPYPSRYFPGPSFNQLVLKALFVGVALDRILGWGERVTAELRQMAADYASERRAAGRPVPGDVDRILAGGGGEAR